MASTAHKTQAELLEHFDPPHVLEQKVDELVRLIRNARHFCAFTGAGISTSAGIPDFRGPEGVWTLRAQGRRPRARTSTIRCRPTFGHMALVSLMNAGFLKYLISSNTDGLHLRSGIDKTKLAELHGNTNIERCTQCEKEYSRDEHVRNAEEVHDHKTGRFCKECGGELMDTIINFNESLWNKQVEAAYANAHRADLMLCLGSSLRVSTWAVDEVVQRAHQGARVVVVNLQITPYDRDALVIHGRTDEVLRMVLDRLELQVPRWRLHRRICVSAKISEMLKRKKEDDEGSKEVREDTPMTTTKGREKIVEVKVKGLDQVNRPYHLFKRVDVTMNPVEMFGGGPATVKLSERDNFTLKRPFDENQQDGQAEEEGHVDVKMTFMGNFEEPPLTIRHPVKREEGARGTAAWYSLYMDPDTQEWEVVQEKVNRI